MPSYRPHFGREVRDTKNPSRSGYGRHFGGLAARPIEALGELFRRIALNYLIGNCDAHLKNYSLLLREGAAVSLAPVYDLVCTAIYDGRFGGGLSRSMGIRIGDHLNIDRVTPSDFLLLARDMRQPKRVAATILEELVGSMEAAFETAAIELAKVGAGRRRLRHGATHRSGRSQA